MKINDKTTEAPATKKSNKVIVESVYIGTQSLSEAFFPVIYDELIKIDKRRTFERCG